MCYDLLVFTLLAHYYHIFKIYLFIFFKQSCNNKCNQNYKYIKNICLGPSVQICFYLFFCLEGQNWFILNCKFIYI